MEAVTSHLPCCTRSYLFQLQSNQVFRKLDEIDLVQYWCQRLSAIFWRQKHLPYSEI